MEVLVARIEGSVAFARAVKRRHLGYGVDTDEVGQYNTLCNVAHGGHTFGTRRWNRWAFESSALQGPLWVVCLGNRRYWYYC